MSPETDFTVLLPVWRRDDPGLLRMALDSVFGNARQPARTIVCADGELSDELEAALACYPVDIIRNSGPDFGLQHNLNRAIADVGTPWIARADADDINLPERFARQIEAIIADPRLDVVGTDLIEVNPDGREVLKHMPPTHDEIVKLAPYRCPINHNTVFVRTAALQRVGGYPNVSRREDYALWLKMLADNCRFGNVSEPLIRMTMGADFFARRSGLYAVRSELLLGRFRSQLPGFSRVTSNFVTFLRIASMAFGPRVIKPIYRLMRARSSRDVDLAS